jgi:sulfur relay (sulfurtransferase) complex TusBCD TusD component (DsrE family)
LDGVVETSKLTKPTEGTKFAITRKWQRLLDDRGVGANES